MASAGCRKKAGVPVLESVAAILRQMMPLLPMPVRITRPRQSRTSCTALRERAVEPVDQGEDGGGFGLEDLARQREVSHGATILSMATS